MNSEAIGATLRSARKSAALSVAKTSEKVGVSPATIKRWEAGKGLPPVRELESFLDRIGTSANSPLRQVLEDNRPAVERDSEGRPVLRLLRAERRRNQLTLESISIITGLSVASLHRYETGERTPDPGVLRMLALAYGCSPTQTELLVQSLQVVQPLPEKAIIDLFTSEDSDPHYWVYGKLEQLRQCVVGRKNEVSPGAILDVLHGMVLMGDHHSILEAWTLLKPLAANLQWTRSEHTQLGCTLLLARLNVSADRYLNPAEYKRWRDAVDQQEFCYQKLHNLLVLARVAFMAGDLPESLRLLDEVDLGAAQYPGVDVMCELNRRAIACTQSASQEHVKAIETIWQNSENTMVRYTASVALFYALDRLADRSGLEWQLGRVRELERLFGLGSPMVNRVARSFGLVD